MFRKSVVTFVSVAIMSMPALAREVMPLGTPAQGCVPGTVQLQPASPPDQDARQIGLFDTMVSRSGTWVSAPSEGAGN